MYQIHVHHLIKCAKTLNTITQVKCFEALQHEPQDIHDVNIRECAQRLQRNRELDKYG